MSLRAFALVIAGVGFLTPGAQAADKKVTLLFTGDNGGEVAPCG